MPPNSCGNSGWPSLCGCLMAVSTLLQVCTPMQELLCARLTYLCLVVVVVVALARHTPPKLELLHGGG